MKKSMSKVINEINRSSEMAVKPLRTFLLLTALVSSMVACKPFRSGDAPSSSSPNVSSPTNPSGGLPGSDASGFTGTPNRFPTPDEIQIYTFDDETLTLTGLPIEGENVTDFFSFGGEGVGQYKHVAVENFAGSQVCTYVYEVGNGLILEAFTPDSDPAASSSETATFVSTFILDIEFVPADYADQANSSLNEALVDLSTVACSSEFGLEEWLGKDSSEVLGAVSDSEFYNAL